MLNSPIKNGNARHGIGDAPRWAAEFSRIAGHAATVAIVIAICGSRVVAGEGPAGDLLTSPEFASGPAGDVPLPPDAPASGKEQRWNFHVQNTDIVQGDPGFPAKYSGPNSLNSNGETQETVSLDLMFGLRLWRGAEFHIDGMMWQGFGLSNAHGAEGFPNGEAFRLGAKTPNYNLTRVFIRQTIGFGGEQEDVPDDPLHLAGKQDVSRITLTLGRMSAKDIFDNNAYANDPRGQFMNWSLMANSAWDYPADSLGYITGLAIELNQPKWALRYGFFQVPRSDNGTAIDQDFTKAWSMVMEFEGRFSLNGHPGTVRLLGFLASAHMGSFQEAINSDIRPADITATEAYRFKYGFGLNIDQEIVKNIGVFARLGWNDGRTEDWSFDDVDHTVSAGVSVKGEAWRRPDDVFAVGGVINGITSVHAQFFADGGTGILAGDGNLNYGLEKIVEAYYDAQIFKGVHLAFDYQFIANPAYNRDRGPVSVFAGRLHWEF
jgi:high affinity Mn2+ porin